MTNNHALKSFTIIETPFYLLKINERTNKTYLCNALLLKYLHL